MEPKTLFQKIWDAHVVAEEPGCPAVLYIAGPDDEGTKAAAYDLIGRIWGTGEKYR